MTQSSSLKERIHAGELLIGANVPITATRSRLEDVLGSDDYAFVWVDGQHAPFNEERLASFCAAANELDIHVQFRIKHTRHTYLIGNYLDLGPGGVEVPQVEREETVAEAVDNFYYPQSGKRSMGGGFRLGAKDHPERLDYAAWWNQTGVLWMQIESIHAVANTRLLAKSGVDCLSWGPADLQFSIESYPGHPFQTDDDCVRYVVQQLAGTDTKLCYRSYKPDLRAKYIDMGVTMLLEMPQV